jgi:aryl-alcohol dehydrogenase-like predicted oxidoreductase
LAVLARSPLAMGLLGGRYDAGHRPGAGDVRRDTPWWTYFDDDAYGDWLARLDKVRDLLTVGGRTLVQGSLGFLWALDPAVVPLPGVRTPEQAADNAAALGLGPLPADVAAEISALLADSPERH